MDLFKNIAPAQALGIEVSKHWKNCIELSAPLDKNLNDKGTAFAGSLSSILTLTGWALITRELQEAGTEADVMVVKSEMDYSAAVTSDFTATCATTEEEIARVFKDLQERGRARIELHSEIPGCARMTASFAVIRKRSDA